MGTWIERGWTACLMLIVVVIIFRLGHYRRPTVNPLLLTIEPDVALHGMRTGDLVLFSGFSHDSCILRSWLRSTYTHCAMVVNLREYHELEGFVDLHKQHLYLFHANIDDDIPDAFQPNESKPTHGVQFNDLSYAIGVYHGHISWAPLQRPLTRPQLKKLWAYIRKTQGLPFNSEPFDLLRCTDDLGGLIPGTPDKVRGKVCSQLLAEAYDELGLLKRWPIGRPFWRSNPAMLPKYLPLDEIIMLKPIKISGHSQYY